jgi:hypothetical protein
MEAKNVIARSELEAWLDKHNAKEMERWKTKSAVFALYVIGGGLCVVQRYYDGGWDIYTPLNELSLVASFADAEERLGITKKTLHWHTDAFVKWRHRFDPGYKRNSGDLAAAWLGERGLPDNDITKFACEYGASCALARAISKERPASDISMIDERGRFWLLGMVVRHVGENDLELKHGDGAVEVIPAGSIGSISYFADGGIGVHWSARIVIEVTPNYLERV